MRSDHLKKHRRCHSLSVANAPANNRISVHVVSLSDGGSSNVSGSPVPSLSGDSDGIWMSPCTGRNLYIKVFEPLMNSRLLPLPAYCRKRNVLWSLCSVYETCLLQIILFKLWSMLHSRWMLFSMFVVPMYRIFITDGFLVGLCGSVLVCAFRDWLSGVAFSKCVTCVIFFRF